MHRLKDIQQEILQQHRQLSFNRRELNLRRKELQQRVRQALQSKTVLVSTFAAGLLLGWASQSARGFQARRGNAPMMKGLGRWLSPVKGALWSGLIKTVTGYTSDRIGDKLTGELHEHYDQ
jgi:hypothetical protein